MVFREILNQSFASDTSEARDVTISCVDFSIYLKRNRQNSGLQGSTSVVVNLQKVGESKNQIT